jgi:hypothetical protein
MSVVATHRVGREITTNESKLHEVQLTRRHQEVMRRMVGLFRS